MAYYLHSLVTAWSKADIHQSLEKYIMLDPLLFCLEPKCFRAELAHTG